MLRLFSRLLATNHRALFQNLANESTANDELLYKATTNAAKMVFIAKDCNIFTAGKRALENMANEYNGLNKVIEKRDTETDTEKRQREMEQPICNTISTEYRDIDRCLIQTYLPQSSLSNCKHSKNSLLHA